MTEVLRGRGGWGDDRVSLRFGSPGLQARIAHADQELERQGRLEEERRRQRVSDFEQASIAASVIEAMERGEFVSARDYATGVGRTPQESREFFRPSRTSRTPGSVRRKLPHTGFGKCNGLRR